MVEVGGDEETDERNEALLISRAVVLAEDDSRADIVPALACDLGDDRAAQQPLAEQASVPEKTP